MASNNNENNRLAELKKAVTDLGAEISEMEQKKEILSWWDEML